MSNDQTQPEAAPEPEQALPKADLRKVNWYKRGPDGKQLTKAQAEKLLPDAVKALVRKQWDANIKDASGKAIAYK